MALGGLEFFLLILTVPIFMRDGVDATVDMLPLGASLVDNQTLISQNASFELGFFNPNGTSNWYLGIWYAQIAQKAVVWVANRETPIRNVPGVLKLSTDGYLSVFDSRGGELWSTNKDQKGKAASKALILESGNFVLLGADNVSEIVWESFRYPTDTMLPEMKMWKGVQKLTSWKREADPAAGPFSMAMDTSAGKTPLYLTYNNSVPYWTTGEWIGNGFANLPHLIPIETPLQAIFVQRSPSIMYWTFKKRTPAVMVRMVMDRSGELMTYMWVRNSTWSVIWSGPLFQCGVYGACGAYGVCNPINSTIQSCSCLQGFYPKDDRAWNSQEWWSSGCVRRTSLQCSASNGTSTDGFLQLTDVSLSDEEAVVYSQGSTQTVQGCRIACLNNCSCTAFAFAVTDSNPAICRLWFGDLLNILADSSGGQPFFIRLTASDVIQSPSKGTSTVVVALSISLSVGVGVSALLVFALFIQRRRRRLLQKYGEDDIPAASLRTFTYKELKTATNNFSHKLGSGAFGSVFRGSLSDTTLVAVKQLQSTTGAEKQFRAEISTIGNIQHMNLVMLRGFCAEGTRRLLVYEYMPNGSLNSFLSRKSEGADHKVLDWKTRFDIALGTAKGLVYLHEECRDRIIHCDIKPENILLDSNFCPKVADFGLAKLVGRDFSRVLTTTRGTRGYLAPEWISGLPITAKADVYSFGMTLLEIISGRRNLDLSVQESRYYFPRWAATEIHGGNTMGIVDERIAENADVEEARRACLVSMLCIDEEENRRPTMSQVVLMLEGKREIYDTQITILEQHGEDDTESTWTSDIFSSDVFSI